MFKKWGNIGSEFGDRFAKELIQIAQNGHRVFFGLDGTYKSGYNRR